MTARFAVVGCSTCHGHWIVEDLDRQSSAQCPGCGTSTPADRLQPRAEHDDLDVARELRARILADRAGHGDDYANEDDYGVLDDRVESYFDRQFGVFDTDAESALGWSEEMFADAAADSLGWADDQYADLADAAVESYYEQFSIGDGGDRTFDRFGSLYEDAADAAVKAFQADQNTRTPSIPDPETDDGTGISVRRVGVVDADVRIREVDWTLTRLHRSLLDAGLGDAIRTALESIPAATVAGARSALESIGVDAIDGLLQQIGARAAVAVQHDHDDAEERLNEFVTTLQKLGSGHIDNIPTSKDDVFATTALLATSDAVPQVELPLGPGFVDARRGHREAILKFVLDLGVVADVSLVVTTGAADCLWERHRQTLPPSVTEACNRRRGAKDNHDSQVVDGEAVATARDRLDPDGTATSVLRRLEDADAGGLTYQRIRSACQLGDRSESYPRVLVKRLRDLSLVRTDTRPDGKTTVTLSATGGAYLDRIRAGEGFQSVFAVDDARGQTPPKSLPPCRVTPRSREGGGDATADAAAAGSAAVALDSPDARPESEASEATADAGAEVEWASGPVGVTWMPRDRQTALLSLAADGEVVLEDAHLPDEDDPRRPYIGYDRDADALAVGAEAKNPMQYMVTVARALSSPQMLEVTNLESRLGDGFGEIEASAGILRGGRCLGWLGTDDESGADYIDRIQEAHDDLLELTTRLHNEEYEDAARFRGDVIRHAHGLAGTMVHLYDVVGIDVVREMRLPTFSQHFGREGNPQRRAWLLKLLATMTAIQSRYGHFAAYRQLFESREDKRQQAMSPEIDASDPFGRLIGSVVIAGDGVDKLVSDLRTNVAAPTDVHEDAPEFGIEVPVRAGGTPAQTAEAATAILERKTIDATDEAVRLCHGLTRSVYATTTVLLEGLAREPTARDIYLDEIRKALRYLPDDRLLAKGATPTQRAGLRALLAAEEPISQSELARRADISTQSWRNNRDVLIAAGLVEETSVGWRLTLPFGHERGGSSTDEVTSSLTESRPWMVTDDPDRPALASVDNRHPVDALAELIYELESDPERLRSGTVATVLSEYDPPVEAVATVRSEYGLAPIWRLLDAGTASAADVPVGTERVIAHSGPPVRQQPLAD